MLFGGGVATAPKFPSRREEASCFLFFFCCSSLDGGKAHQVDENLCTVDILISAALQLTDAADRASVKLFLSSQVLSFHVGERFCR